MIRFTIRDLLWAMFVVGFALYGWRERAYFRNREGRLMELRNEAYAERDAAKADAAKRVAVANERAERYARVFNQQQMERLFEEMADRQPAGNR